jgi:hypothetical protein
MWLFQRGAGFHYGTFVLLIGGLLLAASRVVRLIERIERARHR